MNLTEIIFMTHDLGIRLSITQDGQIMYKPKSKMPDWLLEQIKLNREPLLRDLLLQDALRYLAEHYVEGADLSVLSPHEDRLNEAHAASTLEELREAVRTYVQAGLREFRRARKAVA